MFTSLFRSRLSQSACSSSSSGICTTLSKRSLISLPAKPGLRTSLRSWVPTFTWLIPTTSIVTQSLARRCSELSYGSLPHLRRRSYLTTPSTRCWLNATIPVMTPCIGMKAVGWLPETVMSPMIFTVSADVALSKAKSLLRSSYFYCRK